MLILKGFRLHQTVQNGAVCISWNGAALKFIPRLTARGLGSEGSVPAAPPPINVGSVIIYLTQENDGAMMAVANAGEIQAAHL